MGLRGKSLLLPSVYPPKTDRTAGPGGPKSVVRIWIWQQLNLLVNLTNWFHHKLWERKKKKRSHEKYMIKQPMKHPKNPSIKEKTMPRRVTPHPSDPDFLVIFAFSVID